MRATRLIHRSLVIALSVASLASALVLASAPTASAADPVATFTGHGFGHGRGMGQWGAYGYAVDHGWTYQQVLDHFYGGTGLAGDAGNPAITVQLMSQNGLDTIAAGPSLSVNGAAVGRAAVLVRRTAANSFQVWRADGCGGPWAVWQSSLPSGVTIATTGGLITLCQPGKNTGYRGQLVAVDAGTAQATVNRVLLNDYLRGVVPREVPASWGSAGSGRGMQALRAQSVAARSYALASNRSSWAKTCDTTACQVYGGAFSQNPSTGAITSLEDARTDQAVAETSGQIRRTGSGVVALTEFSASTGGWSAGGAFPAVQDLGDDTTANPSHNWRVEIPIADLGPRLGTASVRDMRVTQRNGLGDFGGRALQVVIDTSSGSVTLTGDEVRTRLGLRSTWFAVAMVSEAAARSFVTAAYVDTLGRNPDPGGLASWSNALVTGMPRQQVAEALVYSQEHLRSVVDVIYRNALLRPADAAGLNGWVDFILRGAGWPQVAAAVYGSAESLARLGNGSFATWLDGVYRGVLDRGVDPTGLATWTAASATTSRTSIVLSIATSPEARNKRLAGIYRTYLQRPPDPSAQSSYAPLLAGTGDFTIPVAVMRSAEYWVKAQSRFPSV